MALVDFLEDNKYLAPREFFSRTFILSQRPGEYCDSTKRKYLLLLIIVFEVIIIIIIIIILS